MATVYVPSLLRELTGGLDTVSADGGTVGQLIVKLESKFPGLQKRLCDAEMLKPGMMVAVDGQVATMGLLQPVKKNSEVHFLPAISGG
jgi:sulfur-carrier protein